MAISGVVDLVAESDDGIELVDFKTDSGRHAEDEYRKQLSVYYHVVRHQFPTEPVSVRLFYTADGRSVTIDPLTKDDITRLLRDERASS